LQRAARALKNGAGRFGVHIMRVCVFVLSLLSLAPCALAETPAFVTGRPGATESPISTPKGYFQIETELASYTHDKQGSAKASETRLGSTDFRYGVADGADLELIVSPYVRDRLEDVGVREADSGFGDVTLRARGTFFGQDGEGPSFALIGFVTLPTGKNGLGVDKVEGGLIATGVEPLSQSASLTLTLGAAAIHDGAYQGDVYGGANVSFALSEKAGLYVEAFADKAAHSDVAATFDIGGTYLLDAVTQLDCGVNLGFTRAADDVSVFAGWSHRF
jgi:Putative MetA-pathway of phenol degradation